MLPPCGVAFFKIWRATGVEIEGTRRWERAGSRRGQTFVSSVFGRGEGGNKASLWCQFSWASFAMLLIES